MRCYRVNSGAEIEGLGLRDEPVPKPGPREVVVRVRATSLNARELSILKGIDVLQVKPNLIPVSDGAGEVAAVGESVTRVKPGDRVMATLFPLWIDGPFDWSLAAQIGGTLDGMLAEFALLPEAALVPIPDHLSF